MRASFAITAVVLAAVTAPAAAQTTTTISTNATGTWAGLLGTAGFESYGQTFLVPTTGGSILDSFSFWMKQGHHAERPLVRAHLFAWDNATMRTSGSALWSSPGTTTVPADNTYRQYSWATGGVTLTPGQTYVAFLSTEGVAQHAHNSLKFEANLFNTYASGRSVMLDGAGGTRWGTAQWTSGGTQDLRFVANLRSPATPTSTVPEPSTYALLGTGLAGLAVVASRRRRGDR